MYGLGHFIFDFRLPKDFDQFLAQMDPDGFIDTAHYSIGRREGWPLLPMHEDTRMTLMAWATANPHGITDIGFLPCRLTPDGLVHPLPLNSEQSDAVVRYLEACNHTQNLKTRIVPESAVRIAGFDTLRMVAA
jgi:hypothetical protein